MKKLLFLLALVTGLNVYGQNSNAIFFSEQGEKFYVVLNGIRQNAKAETNVKVSGLPAPNYKCKIIFEDAKLGEIDKTIFFTEGKEVTFNIKKNGKGEYVVRLMSQVDIAEAPPTPNTQSNVTYTTVDQVPVTTTYTQTTTTTNTGVPGGGINMNVTDPGTGQNVNMNLSINVPGNVATSSSTTYTTTTTTSTSSSSNIPPQNNEAEHHHHNNNNTYVLPGYNGPTGCPYPMTANDFSSVKQSISSKSFEDSKLTIAKQVISANCLLCSQVKEIMMLFSFESTRLELAKFAYKYTYDTGNYFKLNDAFTFESSIDELNSYINGKN